MYFYDTLMLILRGVKLIWENRKISPKIIEEVNEVVSSMTPTKNI